MRQVFSGDTGASLLKILRKVFAPSYDFTSEVGEATDIFWMDLKDLGRMTQADREIAILSRMKTLEFLEAGLERLKVVANTQVSTAANDSAK